MFKEDKETVRMMLVCRLIFPSSLLQGNMPKSFLSALVIFSSISPYRHCLSAVYRPGHGFRRHLDE